MENELKDLIERLMGEENVKKAEAETYGYNPEVAGCRVSRRNLPGVGHVRVLLKRAADRSTF